MCPIKRTVFKGARMAQNRQHSGGEAGSVCAFSFRIRARYGRFLDHLKQKPTNTGFFCASYHTKAHSRPQGSTPERTPGRGHPAGPPPPLLSPVTTRANKKAPLDPDRREPTLHDLNRNSMLRSGTSIAGWN